MRYIEKLYKPSGLSVSCIYEFKVNMTQDYVALKAEVRDSKTDKCYLLEVTPNYIRHIIENGCDTFGFAIIDLRKDNHSIIHEKTDITGQLIPLSADIAIISLCTFSKSEVILAEGLHRIATGVVGKRTALEGTVIVGKNLGIGVKMYYHNNQFIKPDGFYMTEFWSAHGSNPVFTTVLHCITQGKTRVTFDNDEVVVYFENKASRSGEADFMTFRVEDKSVIPLLSKLKLSKG